MGKHCSKTKTMQGKHCSNPYCFFLKKKTTKLISQLAQYIKKKTDKGYLKKKKSILGKRNEKKMYRKGNKSEKKTRGESYSVLRKRQKN